jgi:outer membrane protein assembly factor BamA
MSNNGATLPFFKQYIAGGPNSMRGWQLRKLGIGSNIFYDTLENGKFNDRYADIILEGNIEYRFDLFPIYGFWIRAPCSPTLEISGTVVPIRWQM